VLGFVSSLLSQDIGWAERLQNDTFCVEWDVKLNQLVRLSACTIKSRSSLLTPAQPGGPEKRAVKRLCMFVLVWLSGPMMIAFTM